MGSKANSTRRLKRVYRCDVCVRTFRSIHALKVHKKTTHNNNAPEEITVKMPAGKIEAKKSEVISKPEAKIAPVSSSNDNGKKLIENVCRKIEFSCPKCDKSFNVYFSAFRHVQKYHCVDSKGNPVHPNSPNLIKPIRREQCATCSKAIKATEFHTCSPTPVQEVLSRSAESYMCVGCAQTFTTIKTFDVHIAGVHNAHVQSLFFPSKVDFIDWKIRVEKQINCKYVLMNRYTAKDVYRCTYSPINDDSGNIHFCPSSFIHQTFTKGVQVHFYPEHFGHATTMYVPSVRDKQFCIKYLLDKAEGYQDIADMKLDSNDSYIEFKNLMEHIVLEAAKLDIRSLKTIMGKALEMSSTLKEYDEDEDKIEEVPGYTFDNQPKSPPPSTKSGKILSDEQIYNALQDTSVRTSNRIRRKSSVVGPGFIQEPIAKKPKMDPLAENANTPKNKISDRPDEHEPIAQLRIVDTFSLSSSCLPKSSTMLLGNDKKKENSPGPKNLNNGKTPSSQVVLPTKETKTDILNKSHNGKETPKVHFSVSLSQSFNDSYKEFVDKNFTSLDKPNKTTKPKKQVMKTKIGQYIPNSPKRKSTASPVTSPQPANTPPIPLKTYTNTKKSNVTSLENDTKLDSEPVLESIAKPNSKSKPKPSNKKDTQSVSETAIKPAHKTETKSIHKSEKKLFNKSEEIMKRKNENKLDNKNEENTFRKNENKPKHKNENKPIHKNENKPINKNENKTIHKNENKPIHKNENKPIHKNEKKPLHKSEKIPSNKAEENTEHKTELKSILKSDRKSLDSVAKKPKRSKLILNKSIDIKYEVKEQENDCNILVLKI